MKFNISMTSLTHLLKILKEHDIDVPADGRTILKTPRSGSLRITEKSGGKYTYFGLKEGLTHTLSEQDTSKYDHFEISLNIDGLPIFKSKNLTMWPLQCAVINIDEVKNSPFVVALYSGAKKPDDLEFLRDFMEELQELMETGFKGKRIVLKNIICDAPAQALIKGIVQFNGRYGCDFCDYRICLFGDGQTSVVPISWIFDDNGTLKCRWTSSLSNIKKNSPPNPNWKVYDIVKIVGPSIGDYDQANQYISDYTTGVSAAEDSITYSMTDPAVVELPEKRKRKNKLCDESDINSETSSCEDTLQRSGKKDEDDPKPTSSDVSEFHDLQQHHMTYKEIPVQTRTPDDVHLKKSRNAMKRAGLKTKNVQLAKTPRYHDTLQGNVAMHEDDYPKSSASSVKEPKETKCKVTMEKLFGTLSHPYSRQLQYRTGKDGKKVLPPVLLTCLKKCVRSFHKQNEIEVKKLKVITRTTPDTECIRQVEIFLSNANTRLKRKPNKGKS
ncbi:hypothetical protein ROHU_009977 [Labeo rohita]|uniref:Transposase domain-containing protein n=1 Tax=Labeo rohita TaxID=84645 RepID=A0A498LYZ8_LABRO|nr:hypothetical protein ROHU_009977 [Labeo rohita]